MMIQFQPYTLFLTLILFPSMTSSERLCSINKTPRIKKPFIFQPRLLCLTGQRSPILHNQFIVSISLSVFFSTTPNPKWLGSKSTPNPADMLLWSFFWWVSPHALWFMRSFLWCSDPGPSLQFQSLMLQHWMGVVGRRLGAKGVVEGLRIWNFGGLRWSGVLTLSSILLRSVAWLVKGCVVGMMGRACVILGCFVGIERLAGQNSVRWVWIWCLLFVFFCGSGGIGLVVCLAIRMNWVYCFSYSCLKCALIFWLISLPIFMALWRIWCNWFIGFVWLFWFIVWLLFRAGVWCSMVVEMVQWFN